MLVSNSTTDGDSTIQCNDKGVMKTKKIVRTIESQKCQECADIHYLQQRSGHTWLDKD